MNAIFCDIYNCILTGGVAASLTTNTGTSCTHTGPTILVLNDQGGSVMSVSDIPATLRAESHQHEPVICFEPGIVKREGSESRFVNNMCVQRWATTNPLCALKRKRTTQYTYSRNVQDAQAAGNAYLSQKIRHSRLRRTSTGQYVMKQKNIINFVPYGTRLGFHEDGIAQTMARMDYKFAQCVCYEVNNERSEVPEPVGSAKQEDVYD